MYCKQNTTLFIDPGEGRLHHVLSVLAPRPLPPPFHFHNGPALILQTFYTISSLRYVNNLVNSNALCNLFSANSTALVRCNSWEEAVNYGNSSADLGEQFHRYSAILLNMRMLYKSS